MLPVQGRHNGSQVFCNVVLMPIDTMDGKHKEIDGSNYRNIIGLRALIDTGATHTCITRQAAHRLELEPLGFLRTTGIHGTSSVPYYFFRIGFVCQSSGAELSVQTNIAIMNQPVKGTELLADVDFDILLGMDVISRGDLFVGRDGSYRFEFDDIGTPIY